MTAGEDFVKAIKPIGCVLFIGMFIAFLVFCFSAKPPVEGYTPPHTTEYYSEHLDEFQTELEDNLFPHLDGIVSCSVEGDRIAVVIEPESYEASSKILYHYYGKNIFDIEMSDQQ